MKIKAIVIVGIIIASTFIFSPVIPAESIEIDEQQTNHSSTLQMGYTPTDITIARQGFIPDKNYITKLDVYFNIGTSHHVTFGIAKRIGTGFFYLESISAYPSKGWNTYDFPCIQTNFMDEYYVMVTTETGKHADIGFATGNPYTKGNFDLHMSYWQNGWQEETNWDMSFKIWGYNNNQRPYSPTLDSPINGKTYTIQSGQTKDITLKATATDQDGDDITYRFWDNDKGDIIGTTDVMPSGQQATLVWEDLGPGTYHWYAKAGDWKTFGEKSATHTFTIEVETDPYENDPPNIPTITDGFTEACTNFGLVFDISTTDPEGDKILYKVDWGDGQISSWLGNYNSGETCNVLHSWENEGTYTIKVKAKDNQGKTSSWSDGHEISISDFVLVNNPPLKPSNPEGDISGIVGEKLSFSATSVDPDADYTAFFWDMDGNKDTYEITDPVINIFTSFVDYTWYKAGTYDISVIVVDQHGAESPRSNPLSVTIEPSSQEFPPSKPFISGPDESYERDTVYLTAMSYDINEEDLRYIWNFDDGSEWHQTSLLESGTSSTVPHVWEHEGTYNVRVKVESESGENSGWSDIKTINVNKNRYSTSFYPQDDLNTINSKTFSDSKTDSDLLSLIPIPELTYKMKNFADEKSGLIASFAYSLGIGCILFSGGNAYSESCQEIEFYVGREKDVYIDVDITQLNGVHSMMFGQASNKKILHIDDFYDDSKKIETAFGDSDLPEKALELTLLSFLLGSTNVYKEITHVVQIIDTFAWWKETVDDHFIMSSASEIVPMSTAESTTTVISKVQKLSIIATIIFFIIDYIFMIYNKMNFEDLNSFLTSIEQNGEAVNSKIQHTYRFKPGDHKIWAGLGTNTLAPPSIVLSHGATGFTAGKVNKITLHGIAPPDKPTINGPTQANAGSDVELKLRSIDHNDDPLDYIIDWGDGDTTTTNEGYTSGREITQEHKYTQKGTYTITVKAKDCDRMESTHETHTITILSDSNPPTVEITRPLNGLYLGDQQKFPGVPGTPPVLIGDITIHADATDQEGIKQVTFKKDNDVISTDTSSQYQGKCYLPSNGFKLVDFKAIAEDYAGNKDTDTQKAFYWNTGSMTMTASNPLGNSPEAKKTYHIKITASPDSTETLLKQGLDDLRDTLQDDYNDATITFTYEIDYGDDTPIETIEKQYPLLQIEHQYQDDSKHEINVTLTTTLNINGETYDHNDFYKVEIGKTKSKSKTKFLTFLNMLTERFGFFSKIINMLLQIKNKNIG